MARNDSKMGFFNFPLKCYSLVWSSRMELFFVFLRFKINPCEVICSKACKNGPGKICGRQLLKNLKWYGLPQKTMSADQITSNFLKTVFHKFYLARFRIPFPISSRYLWGYCSSSGINQTHTLAFLIIQALKSQRNCHGDVNSQRSRGPNVDVHRSILGFYQCTRSLYLRKYIPWDRCTVHFRNL